MVKLIAFYLPQYHPTPENNEWWGENFTEWTNVKNAKPQFENHYQPHIPHETIGYYDLRDKNYLIKQHRIAARYNIFGFCYYYYYFNGKKLLELPLKIIRNTPEIKTSYCLCWANGNWTRAWYGQNKEVLISNEYSTQNAIDFIHNVYPYFTDSRYIKVNEKPLLLVYEPEQIPNILKYSAIWRDYVKSKGFDDLYLVSVEALTIGANPSEYDFVAAVEFAPDWTKAHQLSIPNNRHRIFDYKETVKNMLSKSEPNYDRFNCIFPGWDNTPRYKKSAITFINNTPGCFKLFASETINKTLKRNPPSNQFLFINAWNEWGEGCHIEPDMQNGYTYLQILKELSS